MRGVVGVGVRIGATEIGAPLALGGTAVRGAPQAICLGNRDALAPRGRARGAGFGAELWRAAAACFRLFLNIKQSADARAAAHVRRPGHGADLCLL